MLRLLYYLSRMFMFNSEPTSLKDMFDKVPFSKIYTSLRVRFDSMNINFNLYCMLFNLLKTFVENPFVPFRPLSTIIAYSGAHPLCAQPHQT